MTFTTAANCSWSAKSDAVWADVAPGSGLGSGTSTLRVTEHTRTDDSRTLTLTINSQSFLIRQVAATCTYALSTYGIDARNEGGRLSIRVTAGDGCAWTASSSESWIAVGPASGSGSDYVYLDVPPNTGAERQGVVTIAGQRVVVSQARG